MNGKNYFVKLGMTIHKHRTILLGQEPSTPWVWIAAEGMHKLVYCITGGDSFKQEQVKCSPTGWINKWWHCHLVHNYAPIKGE